MARRPIKRGASPRKSKGEAPKASKMSKDRRITREVIASREVINKIPSKGEQVRENQRLLAEYQSTLKPIKQSNKRGSESLDNAILPPIDFTATWDDIGLTVDLSWNDNSGNESDAVTYTISRAGQDDVIITAPTTVYGDNRDLVLGQTYTWRISLTNLEGTSPQVSASETIPLVAPIVEAGGPYSGTQGTAISLDSASITPGDDLTPTALWSIVSGGAGSFGDPTVVNTTFTPASDGDYVLRLTGSDIYGSSVSDNASLTSASAPTITFSADLITTIVPEIGTSGTFARGSNAYQTDQNLLLNSVALNVPRHTGARLDPDGVTYYDTQDDGTTPIDPATLYGVLIEAAGTNLFLWSEQADQAYWTKTNMLVDVDVGAAPDGTLTLDRIKDDSGGGNALVQLNRINIDLLQDQLQSISCYVKPDQLSLFRMRSGDYTDSTNAGNTFYDLTTGSILTNQVSFSGIDQIGDGFFRAYQVFSATGTDLSGTIRIAPAQTDGSNTVDRDGTSSVFNWGRQWEVGAYPTSYIFSDTDTGSRAFEALKYPTAGNLPLNDAEITFQFTAFVDGLTDVILFESLIDASNYTRIEMVAGELLFVKNIAGTPVIAKVLHTIAANTTYAIVAIQDSATGMSLAIDGGVAGTNPDTANMPLGADFYVGGTTTQANGCFKLVTIKPPGLGIV